MSTGATGSNSSSTHKCKSNEKLCFQEHKTPYEKLGAVTRELFEEHFNVNTVKIEMKNRLTPLCGFHFDGLCDVESGEVKSQLETKYDFSAYYFKSAIKWTTENLLNTEIQVSDPQLLAGFKAIFRSKFDMKDKKKAGSVIGSYNNHNFAVYGEMAFDEQKPVFNSCGIVKHDDLIFGVQGVLDIKSLQFGKPQATIGFVQSGLSVMANIESVNEYNLGIFKRINDSVERGIQLHLDEKKQTTLSFAMKHTIDNSSALKAKLSSAGMIDLAYLYQYKAGVKCSISAQVEAKNLFNGGHKLGFGVFFAG